MELYDRDVVRLKHQESIRGVYNDIKLYFKILDETTVRGFTINWSLSGVTTKLHGISEQVTPSTVKPFTAAHKSCRNVSRS